MPSKEPANEATKEASGAVNRRGRAAKPEVGHCSVPHRWLKGPISAILNLIRLNP
jgi:hypothetical protein